MIRLEDKAALIFLALMILGLGLSAVPVSPATASDWPMFQHDPEHTGVTPEVVTPPLTLLWNYKTGGYVYSSPAVCGGVVYIGSLDGHVYAFNATSGAQIWASQVAGGFFSSPAVSGGMVYAGSYDNGVYAFNATTGETVWNYITGDRVESSPAVSGGVVYVGSFDDHVYALNASTGAQIWNYKTGGWVVSSPAVCGGVVYVGSLDGRVYALNASTGAQIWNYKTDYIILSSPAVSGGVVYIGSHDNYTYALNARTGLRIWRSQTGYFIFSCPAVCDGVVYVGSLDGHVYAFDASTGLQIWNYTTGGWVYSSPAVSGNVVYIGSYLDNRVYALNGSTGIQMWNYSTGGYVYSSPAVCGGVVYVGSLDGRVYAFAPAAEVSFSASGLSGDASGTVLTVDGAGYSYSDLPKTFTWAIESQHTFEWASYAPAGSGKRYVWTETAGLSTARSGSMTVPEGNSIIEASYRTQHYLTVNSPYGTPTGEGWYDAGSTVSSSVPSPVSAGTGTRHVCTGWTGTGSAPISSRGTTVTFTVNSPTSVTWNWKTQYHLSVESSYGTPTGEGWYDAESEATVSVEPAVPMEGVLGTLGARWVFSQWTGDMTSTSPAETVVMDQPKQVTAAWTEDYTALGAIAAVLIAASAAALISKKKQQQQGTA